MAGAGSIHVAVALGSAVGAVARYLCSIGLLQLAGGGFPWGTLAVNVLGSFLIGLFATLTGPGGRLRAGAVQWQFVVTGFCGGFTTFSVFSLETLLLLQGGALGLAALNLSLSVVFWLVAVWAGFRLGAALNRRGAGREGPV